MGATSLLKLVPANAADTIVKPITKTRIVWLLAIDSLGLSYSQTTPKSRLARISVNPP
jgi:hypothetical protein